MSMSPQPSTRDQMLALAVSRRSDASDQMPYRELFGNLQEARTRPIFPGL
jgi:hypothetical protein